MDKNDIKENIKVFDESQSVYMDLEEAGFHLKLKKVAKNSNIMPPAPPIRKS